MVQSTLPREFVLVVSIAMVIEFDEHQPSVQMLLEPMEDHQKYLAIAEECRLDPFQPVILRHALKDYLFEIINKEKKSDYILNCRYDR